MTKPKYIDALFKNIPNISENKARKLYLKSLERIGVEKDTDLWTFFVDGCFFHHTVGRLVKLNLHGGCTLSFVFSRWYNEGSSSACREWYQADFSGIGRIDCNLNPDVNFCFRDFLYPVLWKHGKKLWCELTITSGNNPDSVLAFTFSDLKLKLYKNGRIALMDKFGAHRIKSKVEGYKVAHVPKISLLEYDQHTGIMVTFDTGEWRSFSVYRLKRWNVQVQDFAAVRINRSRTGLVWEGGGKLSSRTIYFNL